MKLEPASFTKEKFALYAKYQASIHHDKEEDISEGGFKRFLVDSPMKLEKHDTSNIQFGSFHQKYIVDDKLVALAVIDILPKCVSSVYFLYDPDYSFLGLGKYSVFREISLVQEFSKKVDTLQHYYMGKRRKRTLATVECSYMFTRILHRFMSQNELQRAVSAV